MEHRPSTSSGNFREEILSRLEARNASMRPWTSVFKNYSLMSDELVRAKRRIGRGSKGDDSEASTTEKTSQELKQLREELADVYKQKSRNDQSLIEANRKLDQHDAVLSAITKDKFSVLNCNGTDCFVDSDMSALLETKTAEVLQLQQERLVLINRIRDLNEQHANLFNAEVDQQQERQQRRIREEIARACEDTSLDEKAQLSLAQSNLPLGDVILGDAVPRDVLFKAEANDGEVYDVLWLSTDTFATGGTDKRVRLWRVDERRKPTSFMGHTDKVSSARFLSATQVVSGSNDRLIKMWDVRSQRCVRSVFPGSTILDIVGVAKGVATFSSGHFDRKLRFWDSRNPEPVHVIEMAGKVTSLDISSDGFHLLCSTRDDTLSLLDIRKYQTVHIYSLIYHLFISVLSITELQVICRDVFFHLGWNTVLLVPLMAAFLCGTFNPRSWRKFCTKEDMSKMLFHFAVFLFFIYSAVILKIPASAKLSEGGCG
ncbi:unnamed protein product [Nippostrongylus brasiliensis]|uniref:WD_REPEATS_REGION domain-containing protein n=1 Tax=Nippostrongylus brasiliensis TaxID=27835 RepID=A0A0N4Y099_NIPBR|nr:unnamed protein product [Nippostrongylus brasiliensis]